MWESTRQYLPQVGLLVIGTILGVLFSSIVLYTEIRERMAENGVRIEANKEQIERLWEAHQVSHEDTEQGE